MPDGVASVTITRRNGSTKTIAVRDNVYETQVTGGAATLSFTAEDGHHVVRL